MTNKPGKTSANTRTCNGCDIAGEDEIVGDVPHWFHGRDSGDTEVDDEGCINDSDTGTSFSLEECMNEFRARRNRRNDSQSRYGLCRELGENDGLDFTEMDLINQNLSNKAQERKCKPCKDGFCYCFSSDSGEGPVSVGGQRTTHLRTSRNRRFDCSQTTEAIKHPLTTDEEQKCTKIEENNNNEVHKTRQAVVKKNLTTVSQLETSNKDAPLIHIIQELRDNCFISKVKVNKEKLQNNQQWYLKPSICASRHKTSVNALETSTSQTRAGLQEPTAPEWADYHDFNLPQRPCKAAAKVQNSSSKKPRHIKRRNQAAGLLFQKRLFSSKLCYKNPDVKEPPVKPPRSSLSFEESSSTLQSSLSIREAERVLDEFLSRKGYTIPRSSKIIPPQSAFKNYKSFQSETSKYNKWDAKKISKHTSGTAYPSLKDFERDIDLKMISNFGKPTTYLSDNQLKDTGIGWRDPRINYMLECDIRPGQKSTRSTQAEPQKRLGTNVLSENPIGWLPPPKVDLDTVDGVINHNLASNVENKQTPVKSELPGPNRQKKAFRTQRIGWSEHLRNLSPWNSKKKCEYQTKSSKSNSRLNSKDFLNKSKKKILRLISPKKENKECLKFETRKTPYRHVGIQTSADDLGEHESPPGSYHSPVQHKPLSSELSDATTVDGITPKELHFDFSRQIQSPPKKLTRPSQRKLHFPLNCTETCAGTRNDISSPLSTEGKTYRSFNAELDRDLSHSKISYILSSIRTKLEANDDFALKTFRECQRSGNDKFTHADGQQQVFDQATTCNMWPFKEQETHLNYPIYSEIDDDSILITESPNFDNRTGIQHFIIDNNPELIYARVNKSNKRIASTSDPMPLGSILHSSIRSKAEYVKGPFLAPLPEPPESEIVSFSTERSSFKPKLLCQSLNNVRVIDNSQSKAQQNLSKSDFSLHRSEIFFDNLCKSELVTKLNQYESGRQQKILNNDQLNNSPKSFDCSTEMNENEPLRKQVNDVAESYYEPNESLYMDSIQDETNSHLSVIDSPSRNNQSTPKKPLFTTKDGCEQAQTNLDSGRGERAGLTTDENICEELRNSYAEISYNQHSNRSSHSESVDKELKLFDTLPVLKHMTIVLRKSFRKGKEFIKMESKRLSSSLHINDTDSYARNKKRAEKNRIDWIFGSSYDIASLFTLNHSISIDEQLNKVVHICRKLPDLENSTEMVEAERLLLFSKLRKETLANEPKAMLRNIDQSPTMRVFVDDMFLPLRIDAKKDIYFNYFYIVTFECGGIIRSTQSKECQNDELVFRDCGIEFAVWSKHKTVNEDQNIVRCNIFMLRLRKVSTLSLEPKHKKNLEKRRISFTSDSSSSADVIDSRFRLQASFTLDSTSFIPYEYVQQESNNNECICIRSSKVCNISLMTHSKSSILSSHIKLKGRAEIRFQKSTYGGFLNVEDPFIQHNWNRRWCTLNGFLFSVWNGVNNLNEVPLFYMDLCHGQPQLLYPAPRDTCARPRSFCLHGGICTTNGEVPEAAIYFSAESQDNLNTWLEIINFAFNFSKCWLNQS